MKTLPKANNIITYPIKIILYNIFEFNVYFIFKFLLVITKIIIPKPNLEFQR